MKMVLEKLESKVTELVNHKLGVKPRSFGGGQLSRDKKRVVHRWPGKSTNQISGDLSMRLQ